MKRYKVKVCIPNSKNKWKASIEVREIEEQNVNYVIMHVLTVEEYKAGARIIEIWEQQNERKN